MLVEGRGEGRQPVGGRWNLDHENREPPPKGVERLADAVDGLADPWWPSEDDVDAEVREDLDRMERDGVVFTGSDGPRWAPATRAEALAALDRFVTDRLPFFGPHEDAVLRGDRQMAHSLLSPALNLGLLHPLEVVRAAETEHREGRAPLASVEGFVRQVLGWREYVWGVYWWTGPGYRARNALEATEPVPDWMWDLDAGAVDAACLSWALASVRDTAWTHHIPRLMVLGNYALQRGLDPAELTAWFHTQFVDGYDWVMLPNVVGMSQHADGGLMATKPYAAGGAYIHRMTDLCGGCRYDPKVRVGPDACPFTAGYWAFLDRNADRLRANPRMTRAVAGLDRLKDRHETVEQEVRRGDSRALTAPAGRRWRADPAQPLGTAAGGTAAGGTAGTPSWRARARSRRRPRTDQATAATQTATTRRYTPARADPGTSAVLISVRLLVSTMSPPTAAPRTRAGR